MFFFIPFVTMPFLYLVMIYIAAAILPAILLMRYVYQQDSIEKEPPQLLISLAWHGVLAALVSIVLEMIAQSILNVTLDQNDPEPSSSSCTAEPGMTRISISGLTALYTPSLCHWALLLLRT